MTAPARCICHFSGCNGLGVEHCEGCGGDACICACGGERPCVGCDLCEADGSFDSGDDFDRFEEFEVPQ